MTQLFRAVYRATRIPPCFNASFQAINSSSVSTDHAVCVAVEKWLASGAYFSSARCRCNRKRRWCCFAAVKKEMQEVGMAGGPSPAPRWYAPAAGPACRGKIRPSRAVSMSGAPYGRRPSAAILVVGHSSAPPMLLLWQEYPQSSVSSSACWFCRYRSAETRR